MTTTTQHRRRVPYAAAESLAAIVALALVTWGAYRLHANVITVGLLYLCLVVIVSLRGSLRAAVLAGVIATLSLDYFFMPPLLGFTATDRIDVIALAVFVGAAVITRLVTALRRSEDRWKNAFENNPTMYFMVDPAGTIVSVNPFGAEQLGYTVDELVGQSVLKVFHEPDREAAREHVAGCLAQIGQSRSWELRKVRKDGTMLWVRETARAVQRGAERPIVLVACEDITEGREALNKLRGSATRFRGLASLLDLTHDAIFVRNPDNVIVYWNRGAAECYGWPSAEAVGRVSHELLKTVFPQPLAEITATLERTGRWEGELVHTTRDGTPVMAASRWSLRRDDEGRPTGTLETNNDITARKSAEEGLRRAQTDLARVSTLTTLGELAASIAHELRQPLSAVAMSGSATLRWLNRESPDIDEARDAAARTVREAQRAEEVIRGLRALFGARETLHRGSFDMRDAIREVLALVRGELRRHGIAVRTDLASELPTVVGDRVQLQQVLLNLVLNGMDAMRSADGGGARELVLRAESAGPEGVAIAVDDSGVGLDPATAERIFDAFFTTKEKGLGMGLSICRSIVAAHGGRLSASPHSPRGATFRFTVPVEGPRAEH